MTLTKLEIISILENMGFASLHENSIHYTLANNIINIDTIKTIPDLCNCFFDMGERCKIREIKNVLNIADPR